MKPLRLKRHGEYVRQHWRRLIILCLVTGSGLLVIAQMAYPVNKLPLYATVDGVTVGGMSKSAAIKLLDSKYQNLPINLYFGSNSTAYRQPKPADVGLTISSQPEVDAQMYPFWLRLVPSSLWWAHSVLGVTAPKYTHDQAKAAVYVQHELGKSCNVTPQNASLVYKNNKLQVVPAIDGGTCKLTDVTKSLQAATPLLKNATVRFAMNQNPAKIHDAAATDFAKKLMSKTKNVSIKAGNNTVTIPQTTLLSWLDFSAPDNGIVATVNTKKATGFFNEQLAPNVVVGAGTTRVTTLDFTETSRTNGSSGQALDYQATANLLNQWLSGKSVELVAQVKATSPVVTYSRDYTATDTGLTALLTHFAQSHSGVYGVGYAELTGQHRHAGYNDTKIFETASTYKLFVAYGTLKRIESGKWHWTDANISNGRNLTKCFDDMIELSDNDCAKALLSKIGYSELTKEIQAAGFTNSSFLNSYIQTTPGDLVKYLGMLESGQLLSASSTNTLIAAMKKNVYRQGIPSGTNGTVADKVGFLYPGYIQGVAGTVNLLHDASIVFDPSGTYVLVIMTGDSSWSTIAELTSQIETWRASS